MRYHQQFLLWSCLLLLSHVGAQDRASLDRAEAAIVNATDAGARCASLLEAARLNHRVRPERSVEHAMNAWAWAKELGHTGQMAEALEYAALAKAVMLDTTAAMALIRSARALREQVDDTGATADHWERTGNIWACMRNPEQAMGAYARATTLATGLRDGLRLTRIKLAIGEMQENMKQLGTSAETLRQAATLADSIAPGSQLSARAWALLGIALGDQGHTDQAVRAHERSLQLSYVLNDELLLGMNKASMGPIYADRGAYGLAASNLYEALGHYKSIGAIRSIPGVLASLAGVFTYTKPVVEVEALWARSIAMADSLHMSRLVHSNRVPYGVFIASLNATQCAELGMEPSEKIERAFAQVEPALAFARATSDMYLLAYSLRAKATITSWNGAHAEALGLQKEVLAYLHGFGDLRGQAAALSEIGYEFGKLGDTKAICDSVSRYMLASIDMKHQAGILEGVHWCYESLYMVARYRGENLLALGYLDSAYQVSDRLHKQSTANEQRSFEMNYNLKLKQNTDSLKHTNELAALESEKTIERLRADTNRNRAWALSGGALLLVAGGALFYRNDRKRRKTAHERDVAELRTKALRSQMNPHFIGNAMQSIHRYMDRNNAPKAGDLLIRFSELMRAVLENSVHQEVPLEEDMDVLRSYLEFERARSNEKFDFHVQVDPALSAANAQVPPLVVQPFLENAIQHGLMNKEGRGKLELKAELKDGAMRITVEDDGIGRAAPSAQAASGRRSLSTGITQERLDQLSKQTGKPAGFRIVDLPQGTRVEIDLPLNAAA